MVAFHAWRRHRGISRSPPIFGQWETTREYGAVRGTSEQCWSALHVPRSLTSTPTQKHQPRQPYSPHCPSSSPATALKLFYQPLDKSMPYRPEAELKRPDLKGEFLCGHCGKTFCHAASLNRHRLNFHGDDQQCQICDQKISHNETVRRHMSSLHGITRVFTCGCCNWTFPDKKELHAHNNSMMRTGQPGDARAIAVSSRAPGSLSQAELKGEERVSTSSPSTSFSARTAKTSGSAKRKSEIPNQLMDMINLFSATSQQISTPSPQIPANWLSALIANNPSLLPILQQASSSKENDDEPCSEEPDISQRQMSCMKNGSNNNNEEEENPKLNFLELNVRTESETASSGPESGICSGEEATDCSPSPSHSSKEGSPTGEDLLVTPKSENRKRKSVDAIASLLFKKKALMG
ncbi:unnamed protein product [Caenorhabditis auriculariae]|uniref:C2H2-type domain-containing protein n=1 Tax=Caenorhabditis auriculariae TaxID=2777116 RepID=A0A8S1GY28_9PELO|nr:unnamed protein product [Caenorhabditis auriculariae]